ncbi:GNAT family N-acetyltransferase [Aestuariivirga sp.]|uniref:GNAT family N-acetyltransferase n=1 Tax=Aestuariivirga sp. TaxID=2650926 RepID=UPI003BAC9B90
MVMIRHEIAADVPAREHLLDRAFGTSRRRKTSERLREGRLPAEGMAFTAVDETGKLLGTLRLWDVVAGSAGPALLLGPLAVSCEAQNRGIGAALMRHAIAEAKLSGHGAIILVGDAPYYARFGFAQAPVTDLHLPGPVERARFLGIELTPGALDGAEGLVAGCGRLEAGQRQAA